MFLLHAEEKFRAYPFVRYARHDIEDATGVAPFAPASFDVVVATNVLHEAHDLERALRGVRSLLAPDGQLVLCEVTTYLPWYDITTALIEARQPFAEAWRTDHPLAGVADWSTALAAAGFDRVLALPAAGSASEVLGQHVLIAAVPGLASDAVPRGADGETAAALPTAAAVADPGAQFLERLAEAAESERLDLLVDVVRTAIAGVLRTAPGALDRQRRLMDLGLDSLMALELRGRLAKFLHLGRPLPSTLVFDHPTMESIARYLEGDVLGFTRVVEDEPARPTAIETRAREVERLSDEEAEAQLIEQLKSLRTER